MSRNTTKPTKWVYAQRKLRSDWASASLIRVFAVRMKKAWVLSYPFSAQRRLWSDWADTQADLSLRLVHSHFVGFVMSWLICIPCKDLNQSAHLSSLFGIYAGLFICSHWPRASSCRQSVTVQMLRLIWVFAVQTSFYKFWCRVP